MVINNSKTSTVPNLPPLEPRCLSQTCCYAWACFGPSNSYVRHVAESLPVLLGSLRYCLLHSARCPNRMERQNYPQCLDAPIAVGTAANTKMLMLQLHLMLIVPIMPPIGSGSNGGVVDPGCLLDGIGIQGMQYVFIAYLFPCSQKKVLRRLVQLHQRLTRCSPPSLHLRLEKVLNGFWGVHGI